MKRELKEYGNYYKLLENGKTVFEMYSDGNWYVKIYDDRGNLLTTQWNDGDKYEWTYDENDNRLTKTINGKLVIDNRVKELTLQQVIDELGYEIKLIKER